MDSQIVQQLYQIGTTNLACIKLNRKSIGIEKEKPEDSGLSNEAIEKCHKLIQLPGRFSMNVAVAGSVVMYDRISKLSQQ